MGIKWQSNCGLLYEEEMCYKIIAMHNRAIQRKPEIVDPKLIGLFDRGSRPFGCKTDKMKDLVESYIGTSLESGSSVGEIVIASPHKGKFTMRILPEDRWSGPIAKDISRNGFVGVMAGIYALGVCGTEVIITENPQIEYTFQKLYPNDISTVAMILPLASAILAINLSGIGGGKDSISNYIKSLDKARYSES